MKEKEIKEKDIDVREFKTWDEWSKWNKDHPIQMEDYKLIFDKDNVTLYSS